MAETLKSGQQRMAEAGQGGEPRNGTGSTPGGNQLAFGSGGRSPGQVAGPGSGGMGRAGLGNGGNTGAQLPLGRAGRDEMVNGRSDAKGPQTASSYRDAPDANPATASAYAQSESFHRRTEAALRREDVPASYRRQVRDYFDSIGKR